MRFVRVVEPGLAMFSKFAWEGEVIDGKVKLKPGYNHLHFSDMQTVQHYEGHRYPNTVAQCRHVEEITEEEFNRGSKR